MKGKLFLIPTSLGPKGEYCIPSYVFDRLDKLNYIIAERGKTARHFIKAVLPEKVQSEIEVFELNKRTDKGEFSSFLNPADQGKDIGLMSEAGCPGVADPGAEIVQLAHQKGIEVVPMIGPSSILLALMASGMNGQKFAFQGYLPPKKPELIKELRKLEQLSSKQKQTQIFIETPYRNNAFIVTALEALRPDTKFCIAAEISLPMEYIKTKKIKDWRKTEIPDLHKKPAIFLLLA